MTGVVEGGAGSGGAGGVVLDGVGAGGVVLVGTTDAVDDAAAVVVVGAGGTGVVVVVGGLVAAVGGVAATEEVATSRPWVATGSRRSRGSGTGPRGGGWAVVATGGRRVAGGATPRSGSAVHTPTTTPPARPTSEVRASSRGPVSVRITGTVAARRPRRHAGRYGHQRRAGWARS